MAGVSVVRGAAYGRLPLIHYSQLPVSISISTRKLKYGPNKFSVFARYSQSQDLFTARLQDSIQNLPKLVEDIVQTSINTGPRGPLRLAQGIQAVIGVGSEWLADASKTANSSGGLAAELQLGLLSPLYLRKLFERLGATYVKLGQFIASAPTLFPPEYVQEFQYCFDRAPSVPFQEIQAILREEFGKPIDTVFEYVDPTPIASASIAQVHGARIRGTQEEVVIKVLKPGIEDILVADLNFVYIVARILEFLSPDLSRASLVAIVKDIRESMLEEVDFKKEAINVESFRRYLEAMGLTRQATAPKVYQEYSTRRVLTMERLYGVPLTDLNSINTLVPNPETSLITALNVWFGSLLACESFHADVHAGNLWLLRDGRIGFLDFGMYVAISCMCFYLIILCSIPHSKKKKKKKVSSIMEMFEININMNRLHFAPNLQHFFILEFSIQFLELEPFVWIRKGGVMVSKQMVRDRKIINNLFLILKVVSEKLGLEKTYEFDQVLKVLFSFSRYLTLLSPTINGKSDQKVNIYLNQTTRSLCH
ncbi:hypothetical protein DH2020_044306 [Rehmannia glutinosa]|uniref:ABC1 atypical kinase-like domain-containing protein n=1 Tax=Rehmannia glutinosa TaxID=99300 RepID=A0ABR0UHI0_REHGL